MSLFIVVVGAVGTVENYTSALVSPAMGLGSQVWSTRNDTGRICGHAARRSATVNVPSPEIRLWFPSCPHPCPQVWGGRHLIVMHIR